MLHINNKFIYKILIRVFGPAEVAVFGMVKTVSLEGNPLSCDCDQQSMMIWIEANKNKLDKENRKFGYGLKVFTLCSRDFKYD